MAKKREMAIITLNDSELVSKWRLYHYREPDLRLSASVQREDGIDMDAILLLEAQQWYDQFLSNGPEDLLPVREAHDTELLLEGEQRDSWKVVLTTVVRRVVRVKLDVWLRSAEPLTDLDSAEARMQLSPMTCGGMHHPVATFSDGVLRLYSAPAEAEPELKELVVVEEPQPGEYKMDQRALLLMAED